MADWDAAKAQALKILGDGAEIPDIPGNVSKAFEAYDKANTDFTKSREDCEAALLDLQDKLSAWSNAVSQFEAKIENPISSSMRRRMPRRSSRRRRS